MTDLASTVFCHRCASPNRAGAKFCTACGQPLLVSAAVNPPRPAAPTTPLPPTVGGPTAGQPAGQQLDQVGSAVAGALQNLASLVRDWLPGAESEPPPEPGAAGEYRYGLKPVSGKDSHVGMVRQLNEDSFLALEFTRVQESRGVPVGFYVVADGMGGHDSGEVASKTVNKLITQRVLHAEVIPGLASKTRALEDTPEAVMLAAVQAANEALFSMSRAAGSDMGTTLTAALLIGDTATIANVGDSRTYLWRQGVLRQVTRDHSLVAALVEAGVLQPGDVRTHPQRNQITRSLGMKPRVEVDIFTEKLQKDDRLVLCSDGLWEMVTDAEIGRVVGSARNPQEACRRLVLKARRAGGEDNITVIVVKME